MEKVINNDIQEARVGCIYKITSPSGRVYIGQTVNIKKRMIFYKNMNCVRQTKLYSSFLKYGVENHVIEVIEECAETSLNNRERYWQEKYDSLSRENGMNLRLQKSDDKSGRMSRETLEKMSKSQVGKKRSDGFKKACSDRLKGRPMFSVEMIKKYTELKRGIPRSDNVKRKISATKRRMSTYCILQLNKDGDLIKKWNSLAEIEEAGFYKSNIHHCITQKYKTAHGFKWTKADQ